MPCFFILVHHFNCYMDLEDSLTISTSCNLVKQYLSAITMFLKILQQAFWLKWENETVWIKGLHSLPEHTGNDILYILSCFLSWSMEFWWVYRLAKIIHLTVTKEKIVKNPHPWKHPRRWQTFETQRHWVPYSFQPAKGIISTRGMSWIKLTICGVGGSGKLLTFP